MHIRDLVCMAAVTLVGVGYAADRKPEAPPPLYDSDPQHLWNRLHAALWDRVGPEGAVYGHDRLDPLLWLETNHLLTVPARDVALKVLREFIEQHGENLIDDPVKKAVLQRDLWAIFDWLTGPHRGEDLQPNSGETVQQLRQPLAEVIQRLALDDELIGTLPNNYADAVASREFPIAFDSEQPPASFLPPDLFDPTGPWVIVGRNGSDLISPAHAKDFSRSSFQVLLNLPAGRQATSAFLNELSSFKEPFRLEPLSDGRFVKRSNPQLPQFPAGTQVALVRSLMLIDSRAQLRATRLVESVQFRVHRDGERQEDIEFVLGRARLFAGTSGGLHAVAIDERDFLTSLNPHPHDPFESLGHRAANGLERQQPVVRRQCVGCHRSPGVHSFRTFVGGFSPPELLPSLGAETNTRRGETAAIRHKQTRYDWGLLEGLLASVRKSASSSP